MLGKVVLWFTCAAWGFGMTGLGVWGDGRGHMGER